MNRIPNPDIEVPDEKVAMAFFRSIRWVNGVVPNANLII